MTFLHVNVLNWFKDSTKIRQPDTTSEQARSYKNTFKRPLTYQYQSTTIQHSSVGKYLLNPTWTHTDGRLKRQKNKIVSRIIPTGEQVHKPASFGFPPHTFLNEIGSTMWVHAGAGLYIALQTTEQAGGDHAQDALRLRQVYSNTWQET